MSLWYKELTLIDFMMSNNGLQETVATTDNDLRWIVDSYFPEPPIGNGEGEIPPEDDPDPPPSMYYNRERPTWNEVYESTAVIVNCKSILVHTCKRFNL